MIPKTKTVVVSRPAMALLNSMECRRHNSGFVNYMKPPTEQADSKVYAEAKKVLVMLGGEWKSGPGAFIFKDNELHFNDLSDALETGLVRNVRQSEQSFFTPSRLACQVAYLASVALKKVSRARILEPSCGEGALVQALCAYFHPYDITANDINGRYVQTLKQAQPDVRVSTGDFGKCSVNPDFHAVVMNPPFDRQLWQQHILHALNFLTEGGILIAIVPRSASLDFLPTGVRPKARLTPVKSDFTHTVTKVSVLTMFVRPSVVHKALLPILDIQVDEADKPLQSPAHYLKLIRKDMQEAMRTLDELEGILKE